MKWPWSKNKPEINPDKAEIELRFNYLIDKYLVVLRPGDFVHLYGNSKRRGTVISTSNLLVRVKCHGSGVIYKMLPFKLILDNSRPRDFK